MTAIFAIFRRRLEGIWLFVACLRYIYTFHCKYSRPISLDVSTLVDEMKGKLLILQMKSSVAVAPCKICYGWQKNGVL